MPHTNNSIQIKYSQTVSWVLLALAASFAVGLFNHGLVPSMEPRFAQAVREMLEAGEWLVPIKNGRPYVEYPAFYYWLAIAGKLIGLPMVAAIRLPTYLAFFAWLYLLNQWQRYLSPQQSPYAYVVAGAAMPLVLFQFSIAQTDGLLVYGVFLSMYGYTRHVSDSEPGKFPWLLWLGAALATLAKGPVGLACTLPVVAIDRTFTGLTDASMGDTSPYLVRAANIVRSLYALAWIRGLGIVLLVTAPWYVLAGLSRGWEFVDAVLIYQNVDRYVTGYSHWQPWWYYFKTVSYDFFPASLLIPFGIWVAVRRICQPQARLVLIWVVFTFVFFSISGSKQGKYILPATPALIALSFFAIDAIRKEYGVDPWRWLRRWYLGVILVWALLLAFVVPFFSDQIGGRDGFEPVKTQLKQAPGRLIHYQWPRSLTLYELGGPMPFVRSARELYQKIEGGEIRPGDYILIKRSHLGPKAGAEESGQLIPYPNDEFFEWILDTKIEKEVALLRVRRGADTASVPETPEPSTLHWRDEMFDTD